MYTYIYSNTSVCVRAGPRLLVPACGGGRVAPADQAAKPVGTN